MEQLPILKEVSNLESRINDSCSSGSGSINSCDNGTGTRNSCWVGANEGRNSCKSGRT